MRSALRAVLILSSTTNGRTPALDWSSTSEVTLRLREAAPSTGATLTDLVVNDGNADLTLTPTFASATETYAVTVVSTVTAVTVTPTLGDPLATIEYLDKDDATLDDAGTADGHQVTLAEGENVIKVKVTAADDNATKTYTVTVNRAACTLNTGDLWCGVVSVGTYTLVIGPVLYGFYPSDNVGALSDTEFSFGLNGYTIDQASVKATGTRALEFSLTSALTTADQARLVLHIDASSNSFAFSDATLTANSTTYEWPNTGLDWSSRSKVTLRLRDTAAANSAPDFADATLTRSVAENAEANQNVGAVIPEATDDDGDTLTYTMEGTDAASFTFEASARQIKTKTGVTYDHEAKSSYAVTIKVSDATSSDTIDVTITVTDKNEPPAAPGAPTVSSTSGSTTSLDVSWTAPANEGKPAITSYDLRYRVGSSGSWTDGPQDLTGTSSVISGLTEATEYQVQVRATNDEGDSGWSAAGTGSTNVPVNNAPEFSSATATREVPENLPSNQNVGDAVTAGDADSDTLTYTLEGTDAASFDIVSTSGQIRTKAGVTYDYETTSSYSVTVKADDGNGGTDTIAVTITVTDVDEPPDKPAKPTVTATSGSSTSLDVSWTAPTNEGNPAIASYDLRYRVGSSGSWTDGPQDLTGTAAAITGLAADTEYQVQVRATNADGDSGWSAAGTGSTNVPTVYVSFEQSTYTVAEGSSVTVTVELSADPERSVMISISRTNQDGADEDDYFLPASVTFDSGETSQTISFDASVDTVDDDGESVTLGFDKLPPGVNAGTPNVATVSITNVPAVDEGEPPAAPAAPTLTATAGSTTSLDVSWTAPANEGKPAITSYDLRYQVGSSGPWTDGPQDVMGTTAAISGLTEATEYQVQVRATNAEGDSGWSAAGTGSTNTTANNAPTFSLATATRTVPENLASGQDVGAVLTATDADGDTLTYTLEGTDAASFDIVSTSGQIRTKAGVTYDYETTSSYSVTVKADDGNGGTDTIAVTITVTDVDEQPDKPAKPTLAAVSSTSLTATWVKPGLNGGPDITGYNVNYRVSTATAWETFTHSGTDVTRTIDGLTASTSYQVQVQALNGETPSDWSDPSDAVSTNTETTLSSDATLSSLELSAITLDPAFSSGHTNYMARVTNNVESTTVTAVTTDPNASGVVIKRNGVVDSTVNLAVGNNIITVEVTAEDETTTETYYVVVTRAEASEDDPLSSDATLSSLELSDITLVPAFSSGRETYTARVANIVSSTSVTAATTDDGASVAIALGHVVDSDGTVNLEVGPNVITVSVTAEDGTTIKTYSVNVHRAAALPTISVQDQTVNEGDQDPSNLTNGGGFPFRVTLSTASDELVPYKVRLVEMASDTATEFDLKPAVLYLISGQVAIGETSSYLSADIIFNDTLDEPDETFTLELYDFENATAGKTRSTITIEDDDDPPSVSVADASATEGDPVEFAVTLSAVSGKTVTVGVATSIESSDTALAGDFTAVPATTLTFMPGDTAKTVTVPTTDDTTDEPRRDLHADPVESVERDPGRRDGDRHDRRHGHDPDDRQRGGDVDADADLVGRVDVGHLRGGRRHRVHGDLQRGGRGHGPPAVRVQPDRGARGRLQLGQRQRKADVRLHGAIDRPGRRRHPGRKPCLQQ